MRRCPSASRIRRYSTASAPSWARSAIPAGPRSTSGWSSGCCRNWASASTSTKCAATGATEDLAYVSPKTGRAVSRAAAGPYKEKLLELPAFLSTGGLPADDERTAQRPRFDGLFPRAPRLLATQQALACRAGEIYGNAAALDNQQWPRLEPRSRSPSVPVDGKTQHQRRSAGSGQAGEIRTGAQRALPRPMRCRPSWRARCPTCATA